MLIKRFEDSEAWQKAVELAASIYSVTSTPPFANDYRLSGQIQSAAVSIASNIAEGFERDAPRELRRFLSIAKGSCGEVRTQLEIARRINYISEQTYAELISLSVYVSKKIGSFRMSIKVSPVTCDVSPVT